jgi:Transcriptional regulator
MELWQMKYFIQVCNDKSFSKAAKKLYISQQGLSKAIKTIEDEFQVILFERSARGVTPTLYGELLYEQAYKILVEYDKMLDLFYKNINSEKGSISIGIPNILHSIFFKTICKFQESYPNINFNLIELGSYSCEKKLLDNLVDVCFALKPENLDLFDYIPITLYEMILLVNNDNPLSKKSYVKTADLKNENFIMLSSDYKIRDITINRCLESGFYPNIVFTTSQLNFIIELVELNKGIAIIPVWKSNICPKDQYNITALSFEDQPFSIKVGFIIPKQRKPNYITNTFIMFIKQKLE